MRLTTLAGPLSSRAQKVLAFLAAHGASFFDDLVDSDAGRIAIVSSTTVEKPTAGGANYTAIKAASESWMRSLADGFRKADSPAASVTFRVKSLAGLEGHLADEVVALWSTDAAASDLNGRVTTLTA